jgi:recombination protein RecA
MTEDERRRAIRVKLARMSMPGLHSIPTGTALGGLPRGAIVELFGPVGAGKTSLALVLVAQWQKAGGAAAWIDADRSFDAAYAARLGVAVERLPVARPESAEQAFAMMAQLALSGAVELLVVDSAAALAPALELNTALGESGQGLQNRIMGSGLRKLARIMTQSGATGVFLNQIRSRPARGGRTDAEELSAGGSALKLYAALRVALEPGRAAGCARFRVLKDKAGASPPAGQMRWISADRTAHPPSAGR